MLKSILPPADPKSAATMQLERNQMRADLIELMAGARRTMIRSRVLIGQADAILARGKSPLIAPHISGWPVLVAEEI